LYIGNAGRINFHLRQLVSYNQTDGSYTYYPISTKTLNVTATAPTPPTWGEQNNNPADAGAVYNLGINIPAAGDYILAIEFLDGSSIFRNNLISGANYPYTIPGLISMTGNTAFLAGNSDYYQGFYYYLYNTIVAPTIGCPSARSAIVATTSTAPTISVAGNVLTSSSALNYQWFLNGGAIAGANAPSYTATQSGNYTVQTTDGNGCSLMSAAVAVTVTAVPNVDPSEIGLIVSPNPTTNGQFELQLETRTRSDLKISLINSLGQRVYENNIPGFAGRLSQTIRPGQLTAGVYYLQVQHDRKMYVRKIVVTQ
jgi:hypothetical protein